MTSANQSLIKQPTAIKQWLITLAAVATIIASVIYSKSQLSGFQQQALPAAQKPALSVAVIRPQAADYTSQVSGYGNSEARFELSLSSEVSGLVQSLNPAFEPGKIVKKGTPLATLDATRYRQALAAAESTLAAAKVTLLEEELNRRQAISEWQRAGLAGEPDSELVLRKPQLAAAQAALTQAQISQQLAASELAKTQLIVPFNSVIRSRAINPGSVISSGSNIGDIYSSDVLDIRISLSAQQWAQLPARAQLLNPQAPWPVTLHSEDGRQSWQGYISAIEQHINSDDRQRTLIISIDQPLAQTPPIYPGQFVQANIPGKHHQGLWQLPASSISKGNTLWYVDGQQQLQQQTVEIIFRRDDFIFIQPLFDTNGEAISAVIRQPLSSYLPGMPVVTSQPNNPVAANAGEQQ